MGSKDTNPNSTPFAGMKILSAALSLPAPTSLDNSPIATVFTFKETAKRRRRFDSDVGERFTEEKEVTSCSANNRTTAETMVDSLSA